MSDTKKNATITSGGLKCDNTECDWIDTSISFDQYSNWLNKPCPKCGENVLTEGDLDRTMALMNAIEIMNAMSPEQLDRLSAKVDIESLKQTPFLSGAEGIERLSATTGPVMITISTHKELKVVKIKEEE